MPLAPKPALNHDRRLRASPAFAFALMPDGRPFVAQQTEPYLQYWLSDRERRVWAAFSGRHGATPAQVLAQAERAEQPRLAKAIAGMAAAGVLAAVPDDSSRYDAAIVEPYLKHRPFPPEIASRIAERAALQAGSLVLDLAGGPGDLALQLARRGAQVSLMDWSRAFLASARRRAQAEGLALRTLHESCNRLGSEYPQVRAAPSPPPEGVQSAEGGPALPGDDDGSYDLITVSQALHWLDDVAVCRGVLRVLRPGGSFVVVHSAFDVPADHPLAHVLGHDSVLGRKARRGFAAEVQALHDRVALLFRALDSGGVERYDPTRSQQPLPGLRSAGLERFRQRRPLGLGFLRGLLTPRHLQAAGLDEASFWAEAEARCAAATPDQLLGTHDWALLHFERRDGQRVRGAKAAACPVQAIGFGDEGVPSDGAAHDV